MDRVKGEVHSSSMNIIYILQMPINSLNTPTGEGMFMPSINNLVNRRLQSLCIIYLGDLFRGLMDAQWIFRGHHGSNARIEGGVRSTASSSQQELNSQESIVPFYLNWGAQYMAETPALVEAQITNK